MDAKTKAVFAAYLSGKEWHSETRSEAGNIFLTHNDLHNLLHYGASRPGLAKLLSFLECKDALNSLKGTGIDDYDTMFEISDYIKIMKLLA